MKAKKSWAEKLADNKDLPRIIEIDARMSKRWGEGKCVIPSPREVDGLMRWVPCGHLVTIGELRTALAQKFGTTIACPITTGIFAWISANAAGEAERAGVADITPYWRALKTGGELNAKYPGGLDAARARLEAEGHRVFAKGRRLFIADYERVLFRPGVRAGDHATPRR